jgi:IS30 family transposase
VNLAIVKVIVQQANRLLAESMTDEELQDVIAEINDRPRRILGYRTA